MTLESLIERHLWDLVCQGGGDNETIAAFAKRIAKIARRKIATEAKELTT